MEDETIEDVRAAYALLHRDMAALRVKADALNEALGELLIDMRLAQSNMRRAALTDHRWEGCAEAIQPRVDAAISAIANYTGA